MKRLFFNTMMVFIILCFTIPFTGAGLAESKDYDFKSFYWGDSSDKVISVEGTPDGEGKLTGTNSTYIAYETTAVGMDALLGYYFCDEGLYAVRYILLEEHSNESLYIDDYVKFETALTKKYGKPLLDLENWENDSKKEFYADRKGDALCYGYLTYETVYTSDTASIVMMMSADNYEITTTIDYKCFDIDAGEADYSSEV